MNNLCGNCKFWGEPDDVNEFRQCQAIPHDIHCIHNEDKDFENFSWLDEEGKEEYRKIKRNKAVVTDGSGYFAAIKTKEDFGCVLFEEKKNGEKY